MGPAEVRAGRRRVRLAGAPGPARRGGERGGALSAAGRAGGAPALLWHTYPLGLLGADQTGADRTCRATLRELVAWLPHVVSLGADTLLLGPVFASLAHGYDTVDHRVVDDRLGTAADLDALVEAAAAHGVGVVLDGAFAYASRSFHRLADPAEEGDPWFLRDARGELVPWRVDSLVTPDHGSPGYRTYVAEVLSSWLDHGIRGWRLDSAWSVPPGFWRSVLARVRQRHPTAWFLGQVFDDDLPPVVDSATYSGATGYGLLHGVREWLTGGAVDAMVATLRLHRHNGLRSPVHTFLGNHDVARLADVVGARDADLLPAAFCLLTTLPGVPAVYYGDEFGVTSAGAPEGSDALLRPAMAADAPDRVRGPGRELLAVVRELGAFRRDNLWLTTAALDDVASHDGALTYRVTGPGRRLHVLVNPTSRPVTARGAPDGRRVLGPGAVDGHGHLRVAPRGWAVVAEPST